MSDFIRKSQPKSQGLPAHLAPGNPGNSGGKPGRSGRQPKWLKRWCENLLADKVCRQQVKEILRDKNHPAFKAMWCAVADRAYGKPIQGIAVASDQVTLERLLAGTWAS